MKSVAELNEIVEGNSVIRAKVAAELLSSWPIPHNHPNIGKSVLIFYHAMNLPPPHEYYEIYPPNWLVVLDAESGKPFEVEKKDPKYYGINSPPNKPFSRFKYSHPFEGAELDQKIEFFSSNYTKILNLWFNKDRNYQKSMLKDFQRDFNWFVPSPTHRFYSHLNPEFAKVCGI
ncbi:hypothetical protein [Prosthecobacter sp.]|uniref:hypothetical protein n=1 Tax=Prosthecobacter sp. TaxID=1965333 RepID=UPI0037844918